MKPMGMCSIDHGYQQHSKVSIQTSRHFYYFDYLRFWLVILFSFTSPFANHGMSLVIMHCTNYGCAVKGI